MTEDKERHDAILVGISILYFLMFMLVYIDGGWTGLGFFLLGSVSVIVMSRIFYLVK